MNIIEALDDPELFGGMFSAPSWRPWRAFLVALFGLPLSDDLLTVYRACTGRSVAPRAPFREAALVCGRRGGKSRVLALIAAYLATVPDYTPHTAPGETLVAAIIAADRRQARVILGYVAGLLRAVPALAVMIEDVLAESIRLTNGVTIEVHTGNIGAPRGRTFVCVLADEIAFWASGDAANPDTEVIAAVRPGLASIPGSMLLMASSPYARRGVLFDTFARYYGRDDAPVLVWRGTTAEMNATIDPAVIDAAYAADPDSAAAEYGAEFRSDIAAFISRDAIEAVTAPGVRELPPGGGLGYVAFVDPSGGSADSMTLAIAHLADDGTAVLDAVREVRPPFSPDAVVEEFAALLASYGITRVTGDAYAGEWPRERFALRGIGYDVSRKPKSAIYTEFLPALNGRRVRLLDAPRLTAQLCALERRTARGGRDSIDHAPGAHDDLANAAAGALVTVLADRVPTLVRGGDLLQDGRPVDPPGRPEIVFTVATIDRLGRVALVTFARNQWERPPLIVLDFNVEPLSRDLFAELCATLDGLAATLRPFRIAPHVLTASALIEENARLAGLRTHLVDPPEGVTMSLAAAAHVAAGRVKISAAVAEKARTSPFGASIELRAGALDDDDPLRTAMVLGVHAALDKWRKAA